MVPTQVWDLTSRTSYKQQSAKTNAICLSVRAPTQSSLCFRAQMCAMNIASKKLTRVILMLGRSRRRTVHVCAQLLTQAKTAKAAWAHMPALATKRSRCVIWVTRALALAPWTASSASVKMALRACAATNARIRFRRTPTAQVVPSQRQVQASSWMRVMTRTNACPICFQYGRSKFRHSLSSVCTPTCRHHWKTYTGSSRAVISTQLMSIRWTTTSKM